MTHMEKMPPPKSPGFEANLRTIETLRERYQVPVGYSGHERGLQISVAAVALGGMIGDQLLYFLGLRFGPTLLKRFAKHQKKIRRAQRLIQRHPYLFVIGTRFMYGFRIIGPILIGASHLPPKIFLPLNIVGAIAWALIFTTLGYVGGEVIAPWLHNLDQHLKHWAWLILVVVAVIAVRLWLKHREKTRDEE